MPRPAAQWVRSLDVLRGFPARALAKSHGRSVVGLEASADHLRNYRDVIAWTHDQTIRYMNKGYVRDQIPELLGEMPPHLRAYETTGLEGYGSVAHAVPQIYTWYLGLQPGRGHGLRPGAVRAPSARLRGGDGRRRSASASWPRRPCTTATTAGRSSSSATSSAPTRPTWTPAGSTPTRTGVRA